MSRAKTVIPQPEGATTMERLDKMVRTIFAAGRQSSSAERTPAPVPTPKNQAKKTTE